MSQEAIPGNTDVQVTKKPKNIYIIGPGSTGKTTLVNALQAHFHPLAKPEVSADEPDVLSTVKIVEQGQLSGDKQRRCSRWSLDSSDEDDDDDLIPVDIEKLPDAATIPIKDETACKVVKQPVGQTLNADDDTCTQMSTSPATRPSIPNTDTNTEPSDSGSDASPKSADAIKEPPDRGPRIIPEVARTVFPALGVTRQDMLDGPAGASYIQYHILLAQHDAERAAIKSKGFTWFIADRSAIDPIVYSCLYADPSDTLALTNDDMYRVMESRMKEGLVFLCEAGARWRHEDDGFRVVLTQEEWAAHERMFGEVLGNRGVPYQVVPRTMERTEDRVGFVLKVWEQSS